MKFIITYINRIFFISILNILILCQASNAQLFETLFITEKYVAYQCSTPPKIDGVINDEQWLSANWTEAFVNIEGRTMPKPAYETKVKMLWDNKCFYIAAILYDKHIWATMQKPESSIFDDNDFEVYIDPNGDTHDYMKLEINALGTMCDLFMDKPYRDGGIADLDCNFEGIKKAVKVYGIVNRTSKKDSCWTIELAIPWKSMIEYSDTKKVPQDGEQWRVNFLRVQWNTTIKDYEYHKDKGPDKKPLPPMHWSWSPQGSQDMHQPETWGYVQFSSNIVGTEVAPFIDIPDEKLIWSLWQVYYLYQTYPLNYAKVEENFLMFKNKKYASSQDFKLVELGNKRDKYIARAHSTAKPGYWYIRKDGKIWYE